MKQTYDHVIKRYHSLHDYWPHCDLKECACGYRSYVHSGNYILNHHSRGKKPWNYGLTKETDPSVAAYSEASARAIRKGFKNGREPWNKGMAGDLDYFLCQHKPRRVSFRRKHVHGLKIKRKRYYLEEWSKKRTESRKSNGKKWHSEEAIRSMKHNFKDPEFCRRWAESHSVLPNKLEKRVERLLDRLFPGEYKYVGNFEVFIGGKCPDFINVNGQKKLIEVWGDYWHRDDNPRQRINHFAEYGFRTLILPEHEINEGAVKGKILDFHKSKIKPITIRKLSSTA